MTRHSWLSARADAVESPACCSARSAKVCCGTRNAQWLWSADRSAPADRCERYDGNRAGRLMQHSLADGAEKLTVEATTTTCADDDQPCFGGLPEQLLGRPAVVDDPQYCVVPVRMIRPERQRGSTGGGAVMTDNDGTVSTSAVVGADDHYRTVGTGCEVQRCRAGRRPKPSAQPSATDHQQLSVSGLLDHHRHQEARYPAGLDVQIRLELPGDLERPADNPVSDFDQVGVGPRATARYRGQRPGEGINEAKRSSQRLGFSGRPSDRSLGGRRAVDGHHHGLVRHGRATFRSSPHLYGPSGTKGCPGAKVPAWPAIGHRTSLALARRRLGRMTIYG